MKKRLFITILAVVMSYSGVLLSKRLRRETYYFSRAPADLKLWSTAEPRFFLAQSARLASRDISLFVVKWDDQSFLSRLAPFLPTTDIGLPPEGAPGVIAYTVETPFWENSNKVRNHLLGAVRRSTLLKGYAFDSMSAEAATSEINKWKIDSQIVLPHGTASTEPMVR